MTFTEPDTPVVIVLSDGTRVPDKIWRLSKAQGITEAYGIRFHRKNMKVIGYQPITIGPDGELLPVPKAALTIELQENSDGK